MDTNNLFKFATSELSQDAFICWLMNFAHIDHEKEDETLKECAKEFLRMIIKTGEELVVTKISRQYKNIDVLLEVNGQYNIIIEDKTFTGQHSKQLERYKDILDSESRMNIICVYYKIIEQAFEENNAVNITRQDVIKLFSRYADQTQNSIFRDYYYYLLSIDRAVNKYKTEPIANWVLENGHPYKGFFTHLIKSGIIRIDRHYGWQYVPNRSGGMRALWWYNLSREELNQCNLFEGHIDNLYLQIEDNIITVKITGNSELTSSMRWSIFNYVKNLVPEFDKKTFKKGQWMTVGYIEYDESNYLEKIALMQDVMHSFAEGKFKYHSA